AGGNSYYHDTTAGMLENGNPVYINICEKELHWAWGKRSNVGLDKTDAKGNPILHTLIRYLASKGLPKDAEAVLSLSNEDIMNIENGIPNYRFAQPKLISDRIYKIIWQMDYYLKGGNPSGHSLSQRVEYLKYGLILSYRNFFKGTGTGDIDDEFKALYIEKHSVLEPQYRHRTHNQFVTFFATFGIFGFLLIIFGMFYPIFKNLENLNWLFISFMIIILLSMLSDDTLETSTGVVFFSFFYALFIWVKQKNIEIK
ncbi:MAG: O-antigen ligase family protein, partial [Bacteroidales bacterium]